MSTTPTSFWQRLQAVDRRILYTIIFVSVIIPTLWPLHLPTRVTQETQAFYDAVENIPNGSRIMFAFDFWPSTLAETEPLAVAALRHCFEKDLRLVALSNVGMGGPSIADRLLRDIGAEYGKVYGEDYVNLGYKANYQAVLLGMATNIAEIFPTDHYGTRVGEIPVMQNVTGYDSLAFILLICDNAMMDYWVSLVNARYGVPMVAGVTAVMAPKALSFVQAGQLQGLLGGMKGGAEYEDLIGHPAKASRGMDSQSLIHLAIIGFIIMGNVGHFALRRQRQRRSGNLPAGGR
ncbi:MAG TPA: hypothetical protein VM118_09200 [Acidobacteriota bacterium]|nr:hypothetical protein [Acidobacteriota bacterium]